MKYVVLRRFYDIHEAEIVLTRLQANGIPGFITNSNSAHLLWNMSIAHGGAELMVHKNDLQQAHNILNEKVENLITQEQSNSSECPNCGSNNVRSGSQRNKINWWQLIGLIFVTGPVPKRGNGQHCFNCGNRF